MPEKNKEVELLNELIRATEEGRVTWSPTARVNEFATSFHGHFSALVSREEDDRCRLRIVDRFDRDLIDTVDENPINNALPKGMIQRIARLYDLAYQSGLNVDKAIDEILQGLKSA